MNKDAKRIDSSFKAEICRIKGYILNSSGRGFDGDGYPFNQAVRQLRKRGVNIVYDRKKCSYFIKETA